MERRATSWTASSWKCADPNCSNVNDGEEETCTKCKFSRGKSELHLQKLNILREASTKKPTDGETISSIAGSNEARPNYANNPSFSASDRRSSFTNASNWSQNPPKEFKLAIRGRSIDGIPVRTKSTANEKIYSTKSQGRKVKNPKNQDYPNYQMVPRQILNQPINHRLSSIIHKYSSAMASRRERKEKIEGVKYVLHVSLQGEINSFSKVLGKVMGKVGNNTGAENRKNYLKWLGDEMKLTLNTVNWTRLGSAYDEASSMTSCKSQIMDVSVLAILTSDDEKSKKIDRRVEKFKKYLNRIVNTLENVQKDIDNKSIPDIEESMRKLEECLEYPVKNVDDELILWSKFKIEDILDDVQMAWDLLESDSDEKLKLKQIENPLLLFGGKYSSEGTKIKSEGAMKDAEGLCSSTVCGKNEEFTKMGIKRESQAGEKHDSKLFHENSDETVAIVASTKPDLRKWSISDLRMNTSTPNSTVLVEEDTFEPEEPKGFYDSTLEDYDELDNPNEDIVDNKSVSPKEDISTNELDMCKEENVFDKPKKISHQDFSSVKPTKSSETGYIRVEELTKLIETYSSGHPSPQLMTFLNNLDRDDDGWVFFEEFEAGLTPALLGCF